MFVVGVDAADLFGLSWRPIFLANIVLGGIGLVIAAKILPSDDGDRSTVVDGWGSGLLAATMVGLLYGLIEGSTNGWTTLPVASIVAGVLFFAAFAYVSAPRPIRSSRPRCCRTGVSPPECSWACPSSLPAPA